jgi:hypothetical protein
MPLNVMIPHLVFSLSCLIVYRSNAGRLGGPLKQCVDLAREEDTCNKDDVHPYEDLDFRSIASDLCGVSALTVVAIWYMHLPCQQ